MLSSSVTTNPNLSCVDNIDVKCKFVKMCMVNVELLNYNQVAAVNLHNFCLLCKVAY